MGIIAVVDYEGWQLTQRLWEGLGLRWRAFKKDPVTGNSTSAGPFLTRADVEAWVDSNKGHLPI